MVTSLVLGGRTDDDLAGTSFDVSRRLRRIGEETGRLDDDVDAHVAPGQLGRVALLEYLDLTAIDDECIVRVVDGARVCAVRGVMLEQKRIGRGSAQGR